MNPPLEFRLSPGRRVLFLTKDPGLIRRQLTGELDLRMADLSVDDLLDDINTDVMTPAWVCFRHRPEDIARDAYAGLIVEGKRLIPTDALKEGGFEIIVSGYRKGTGSSRETAVQAEKWSGIRLAIAASFAPIHARNNINQGVLMGDHDMLRRLQDGEAIGLDEFLRGHDPITQEIIRQGGLFPFAKALAAGTADVPHPQTGERPMNMTEKLLARHLVTEGPQYVKPGDPVLVEVDGGYSHDFTSAQVHYFLQQEYGDGYEIRDADRFAAFEDHLVYADEVPRFAKFLGNIETMRELQRDFQSHSNVGDFLVKGGKSPGICHEVARETHGEPGRLHPGHRLPHLHGRLQQRAGMGRRLHRVRQPHLQRLHLRRGAGDDSFRAGGGAASGGDGQGRDAPHPAGVRATARDPQPGDGVHRSRAAGAVDGRAGDPGQHGDRMLGPGRHRRGRRVDLPVDRRAPRRGRRRRRCVADPCCPTRAPNTPAASAPSTSRPSSPWWPIRAIPTTASRPTRPTASWIRNLARGRDRHRLRRLAAPRARSTTSSSTTAWSPTRSAPG